MSLTSLHSHCRVLDSKGRGCRAQCLHVLCWWQGAWSLAQSWLRGNKVITRNRSTHTPAQRRYVGMMQDKDPLQRASTVPTPNAMLTGEIPGIERWLPETLMDSAVDRWTMIPDEPSMEHVEFWRPKGLGATLEAVRTGSREQAFQAALALATLEADEFTAQQRFASPGTVKALLRVFNAVPPPVNIYDIYSLQETLRRIIQAGPAGPTQLVAAFTDPDPQIVSAAVYHSGRMFQSQDLASRLLAAGAAPALVAALSHSSPMCRSVAAVTVCHAVVVPETLQALLSVGLVPALMQIVRQGARLPIPPAPLSGSERAENLSYPSMRRYGTAVQDPFNYACYALVEVLGCDPLAAQHIAAFSTSAESLVRPLQTGSDLTCAAAHLLALTLRALEPGQRKRDFVSALVSNGFPQAVSHLIKLGGFPCTNGLIAVDEALAAADADILSAQQKGAIGRALVQAILESPGEEGEAYEGEVNYVGREGVTLSDVGKAAWALCKVREMFGPQTKQFSKAILQSNALKLVKKLSFMMKAGTPPPLSLRASVLILDCIIASLDQAGVPSQPFSQRISQQPPPACSNLLRAALEGGFIQGVLRLLRLLRERPACLAADPGVTLDVAAVQTLLRQGLKAALVPSKLLQPYLEKAVQGLIAEAKAAAAEATCESEMFCVWIIWLLWGEDGVEGNRDVMGELREAGVWPGLVLQLAGSSHQEVVAAIAEVAAGLRCFLSGHQRLLGELLAAGLLRRLAAATAANRGKGSAASYPRKEDFEDFAEGVWYKHIARWLLRVPPGPPKGRRRCKQLTEVQGLLGAGKSELKLPGEV